MPNDTLIRKPILAGSMKIDLHSAIFANESHEYMFAVLYLPFFSTANEGEAVIKNGAIIYLKFL